MPLGLVDKFKIERNVEPYPAFTGEHFVLLPKKDRAARNALRTYANSMDVSPRLTMEINHWLDLIELEIEENEINAEN